MTELRRSRRRVVAIGGLLAGVALTTGCGSASTGGKEVGKAPQGTVAIPVVVDETGPGSAYQDPVRDGLELGFDTINRAGGIESNGVKHKVQLQIQDSTSSPTQTSNVMHSLAGGSESLVIGGLLSSDAEAAYPIAKSAGLPMIIGGVSDRRVITASRPYALATYIPVQLLIPSGVKQWVAARHPSDVAMVEDTTNDATQFQGALARESLQSDDVPVATTVSASTGQPSYESQASRVASLHPKGIVVSMLEGDAANFVKDLRGRGYKGPILLVTASFSGAFLTSVPASDDSNINVIDESWPLAGNKAMAVFKRQYEAKFKLALDNYGVIGYETAYLVADLLQRSGILNQAMSVSAERQAVVSTWSKLGKFSSLGFTYTVNPGGYFSGPAQFLTITSGKVAG